MRIHSWTKGFCTFALSRNLTLTVQRMVEKNDFNLIQFLMFRATQPGQNLENWKQFSFSCHCQSSVLKAIAEEVSAAILLLSSFRFFLLFFAPCLAVLSTFFFTHSYFASNTLSISPSSRSCLHLSRLVSSFPVLALPVICLLLCILETNPCILKHLLVFCHPIFLPCILKSPLLPILESSNYFPPLHIFFPLPSPPYCIALSLAVFPLPLSKEILPNILMPFGFVVASQNITGM